MPRWFHRHALSLALVILMTGGASAEVDENQLQQYKRLQRHILLSEPAEKVEKIERRREQYREMKRQAKKGGKANRKAAAERSENATAGQRGKPFRPPTDLQLGSRLAPKSGESTRSRLSAITAPPNRLMNDRNGEPVGSCQSEVSIAAHDSNIVAAWNDGIGIYPIPAEDTQGFGYSTDGGLTWIDGGAVPNDGSFLWSSDPVVVVNEKTGVFHYCGLIDNPNTNVNGIAIVRGTFSGSTFTWDPPVVVRTFPNGSNLIDKQWLAVDSLSGNLYMTYSNFVLTGGVPTSNSIQFTRSTNGGATWSNPVTLSAGVDASLVQGSRPCVGPDGELYTVWHAIGQPINSPFGRDFFRVRKSTDGGASFGAQVTADSIFSNFSNGAPGFNRGIGITFPAIAVDRTNGPDRGRVYLSWNESLNFFNDPLPAPGQDPARREVEPNDAEPFITGSSPTPFTPGEILRGVISRPSSGGTSRGDWDYWRWNGNQGQTVIFYLDSLSASLDASFRIFCTDGSTNLAFSQNGTGGPALLVFTAPTTGVYYIRVASYQGASVGGYRILTTTNFPQNDRARDHRDIFSKSSTNGATWGPTRRVNDSPGYFDDWLPEVTVDGAGRVFIANYDWRDATNICGGGSNIYLYRSDDGGDNWIPGTRMTDVTTNWTLTYSTLMPNQGDYIGLTAVDSVIFLAWADGRDADPNDQLVDPDPDVYMTSTTLSCQSAPVALVSAVQLSDTVVVTWSAPQGFQATLSRRVDTGAFVDIGPVTADANDQIVYVDSGIAQGHTYTYRLEVQGFCQVFAGTASVLVPGPPAMPFGITLIRPNPSRHDVIVELQRRGTAPAYLELLDVTGRQINKVQVPCPAGLYCAVNITLGLTVKPGMYFVRLSEGSDESVKRVSIFP
ncbi:MAG TPA: pre-peptidase C-terminal domain-containing protein [Candidatus Eisenbacteria bacterium]|nr:pre-peptidase C-terminal domain-containing protein [Candidatus Eisenbacteria bacterium]